MLDNIRFVENSLFCSNRCLSTIRGHQCPLLPGLKIWFRASGFRQPWNRKSASSPSTPSSKRLFTAEKASLTRALRPAISRIEPYTFEPSLTRLASRQCHHRNAKGNGTTGFGQPAGFPAERPRSHTGDNMKEAWTTPLLPALAGTIESQHVVTDVRAQDFPD
jgi:hypothetical protein